MSTMKPLFAVSSRINGSTKCGGQAVIATMRNGQEIIFRHERSNPYDSQAVALLTKDNRLIGYLPNKTRSEREFKRMVIECMYKGEIIGCAMNRRKPEGVPNWGMDVKFYYATDDMFVKDEDQIEEQQQCKLRNTGKQKAKRPGNEWRDNLHRRHKGRYSYHEIEAMKERRCA